MHRFLLLLGICFGFGLRLYKLGEESLWYDETVSVFLARQSIPELIAHTAGDIHPPGYYLLLHVWQMISQPTLAHGLEFLFAWPSLWFGLLILALLYPIGRRLFNQETALLAVWLTAIHPFHLWYSQEVRMYTVGGGLGLLCLWLMIQYFAIGLPMGEKDDGKAPLNLLLFYAITAALGLYTLYYFAFLLISFNIIALLFILYGAREKLTRWLLAQIAILLFWSPWLPTFWRQATDPPVPPWRAPWQNFYEFMTVLGESGGAYLIGQSSPGPSRWVWALLVGALILYAAISALRHTNAMGYITLLLYTLLPVAIIYLLTALVTPLYHVRYLFTYAAPFTIIMAACLLMLYRRKSWLGLVAIFCVISINIWSLYEFWFNPLYRSDEHRAAVAQLAEDWRPGDAILVNAGWVYPILETYWPRQLVGADGVLPPPIVGRERLVDLHHLSPPLPDGPLLIRAGSVDGHPRLGWGNPQSDFFPISQGAAHAGLAQIAHDYTRIWHYRLYDTVSDPAGDLRHWLETNTHIRQDIGYAGRDYLRVQLYETDRMVWDTEPTKEEAIDFGGLLLLEGQSAPASQNGGEQLYVNLYWRVAAQAQRPLPNLTMSLRLYHADEETLLVQSDAAPMVPTSGWNAGQLYRQPLALSIPASVKPGSYHLELVAYDQLNGVPLTLAEMEQTTFGQRLKIRTIELLPAKQIPLITHHRAYFDYIALVGAGFDPLSINETGALIIPLIWHPLPSAYTDNYTTIFELSSPTGEIIQQWHEPMGGKSYPSGLWTAQRPIQETKYLPINNLGAGQHTLTLRVERSSDGLVVQAREGWWPVHEDRIVIGYLASDRP